jgi:pyridoxamine 5'-phosphate oxidase
VNPHELEFWQGGEHRLHDRFRYRRLEQAAGGPWLIERLAP